MFVCTECKKEYEVQTKFCSECGGKVEAALPVYACSQCGTEYDETTKFCSKCGGKVVSQPVHPQPVTANVVPVQPATDKSETIQTTSTVNPVGKATGKLQKTLSIIGVVSSAILVIGSLVFHMFGDELVKKAIDEKVVPRIKQICKKTFDREPYKIIPGDNDTYKVLFNSPDSDEFWPYIPEPVCLKYDRKEKELSFATPKDKKIWEDGIEAYRALKVDKIKQVCKKTFDREPYKIIPGDDDTYKVLFNSPDIPEPVCFKYDRKEKELSFATPKDKKIWEDGIEAYRALKVEIKQVCKKTFDREPYKIIPGDDGTYKVLFNSPDSGEFWPYISEPVCFKYDRKENQLSFATPKDKEIWYDGIEAYTVLKVDPKYADMFKDL